MPIINSSQTPVRIIIAWSGLLVDIPLGWSLCDGTNTTPNLIATFIRGVATGATDPGDTGGTDSVTLVTAELPVHNHTITDPGHIHFLGSGGVILSGTGNNVTPSSTTGITIDNTGGDGSHENRPAFFELAYIMKL